MNAGACLAPHLLLALVLILPLAAAERVPSATPEALSQWDEQLYARVQQQVAAGHGPSLRYLGADAYVDSADQRGRIALRLADSAVFVIWSQLDWPARMEVVRSVARQDGDPARALLAFHLLADGQEAEAKRLLAMLPADEQARVRSGIIPAPKPTVAKAPSPEAVPDDLSTPRPLPLQFMLFDAVAVHSVDSTNFCRLNSRYSCRVLPPAA